METTFKTSKIGIFALAASVVLVAAGYLVFEAPLEKARSLESASKYGEAAEQYLYAATGPVHKDNATVYYELAYCLRRAGKLEEALMHAKRGLDLCRSHPLITNFWQCCRRNSVENSLLTEEGWIYYDQEDYEKAKEIFDAALKKEKNYFAYAGRGAVFEAQKLYKEAEADFTNAIETAVNASSREEAFHERARFYRNTNQSDKAIADLTAAIAQKTCPRAYFDRALEHKKKGDLNTAHNDLSEAIKLDNKTEDFVHERAKVAMKLGKFNQAKSDIDMALTLNPDCKEAQEDRSKIEAALSGE